MYKLLVVEDEPGIALGHREAALGGGRRMRYQEIASRARAAANLVAPLRAQEPIRNRWLYQYF